MSGIGVVFPGQGAQKNGMANDFHSSSPVARSVFDEVSQTLDLDMARLCFDADPRLNSTEYTQPAILTAEIAIFRTLQAESGFEPTHFGGHSLGEYTAMVAAGVIPLSEGARLVRLRGSLMQQAVPIGAGTMVALIQPDLDVSLIAELVEGLDVDLANHNTPTQLVLSGRTEAIDEACQRLTAHPSTRPARQRKLVVSAPFHSRLMAGIETEFRKHLSASAQHWDLSAANRVLSNFTGGFHTLQRESVLESLTRQISSPVRWMDNMAALVELDSSLLVEIGPSRPLRGFFRSIGATVHSITNRTSARRTMALAAEASHSSCTTA